jgi:hypothetical protein
MTFRTLLESNLRAWLGSRGFVLAVFAAFAPVMLTGAWLGTHQADLAITGAPTWQPGGGDLVEGDNATFTATFANVGKVAAEGFNVSLQVARPVDAGGAVQLFPAEQNKTLVPRLAPGETRQVQLNWTAQPGAYIVLAQVNPDDSVGELEVNNNYNYSALLVHIRLPNASEGPTPPGNLTGEANATQQADFAITSLGWGDAPLRPNNTTTFSATVTNRGPAAAEGNVTIRVGRVFSKQLFASQQFAQNVSLPAGASTNVSLTWTTPGGAWWVEAYVNTTGSAHDPDGGNNQMARPFTVDQGLEVKQPPPPERKTIKDFYMNILSSLYLPFVLPLLALFYAGGVVSDEQDRGALPYLLTRLPRWQLPLAKYVVGFLVTGLAMVVGVVATFFLLFGAPGSDVGFLTMPLAVGLLVLAVYGAFFTALGVAVPHAYYVGLAFVIGWEKVAALFVDFARNLSILQHVTNTITGCGKDPCWPLDQGARWLPTGNGLTELEILLVATVVFLAFASAWMTRREFEA